MDVNKRPVGTSHVAARGALGAALHSRGRASSCGQGAVGSTGGEPEQLTAYKYRQTTTCSFQFNVVLGSYRVGHS